MTFRTLAQALDDHPRVSANPGNRVKILYSPKFDQFGHMELVESGKEDLYGFIQSHKESVDIHVILARFANGDTTALAKRQAFYADLTDFPTTYADVVNTMHGAEDYFTHLPVEVRAKFGHDFNRFLASLDDPQTLVDLGILGQQSGEPKGGSAEQQFSPPAPTPGSGSTQQVGHSSQTTSPTTLNNGGNET